MLFSDGVDWHSDQATFDGTLHHLDEEGVIVYPIRFETRAETERIAREASNEPTLSDHRRHSQTTPPGTTAPTFPSDDPEPVPTSGQRRGPARLVCRRPTKLCADAASENATQDRNPSPDQFPLPSDDPNRRDPSRPSGRTKPPERRFDKRDDGRALPEGR